MSSYEKQVGLKERLKTMLKSQELIPRVSSGIERRVAVELTFPFPPSQELILLGRSQRMMQSNNQVRRLFPLSFSLSRL